MAQLTRAEMEAVIRGGGSVIYKGRVLSKIEHLPSAVDLAAGDPAKLNATVDDLDTQIKALQEQRKTAAAAQAKADKDAKAAAREAEKNAETSGATDSNSTETSES